MRAALLLLSGLALVLAGCSDDPAPAEQTPVAPAAEPEPALPANYTQEFTVVGGADPSNFVIFPTPVGGGGPCSLQASSCQKWAFTLNRSADVSASVRWGVPANDLDLYIVEDGVDVSDAEGASDVTGGPGTEESVTLSGLSPGDYEVWVSHWFVAQDTYTLAVTFE